MWHEKTVTASRVRQRIETVLDYASSRGWRTGENPARWRGHLANLLPARKRVAPVNHHAAMPWSEVPAFLEELGGRHGLAYRALHLLVLTAVRSGEVRGMVWREVDLGTALWTIPASRMKAAREHRVPLAPAALELLRDRLLEAGDPGPDDLVFPSRTGGLISDRTLARALPPGASPHGFRATFRTWAGERTDFARETAELALAHQVGSAVEQSYARGDQLSKRRGLMLAWATFCSTAPTEADVIPFRAGAA
jgi:integrase